MKNRFKAATPRTIMKLHHAEIRTAMVKGNNVLTAISVAKQIRIMPSEYHVFYDEIDKDSKEKTLFFGGVQRRPMFIDHLFAVLNLGCFIQWFNSQLCAYYSTWNLFRSYNAEYID